MRRMENPLLKINQGSYVPLFPDCDGPVEEQPEKKYEQLY